MLFPAKNSFGYENVVKDFHNDGEHTGICQRESIFGCGPLLETEEDVTNVAKILHETYKSKVESNNIVTSWDMEIPKIITTRMVTLATR
jgi:sirohydrochlorin cobaltochelatase